MDLGSHRFVERSDVSSSRRQERQRQRRINATRHPVIVQLTRVFKSIMMQAEAKPKHRGMEIEFRTEAEAIDAYAKVGDTHLVYSNPGIAVAQNNDNSASAVISLANLLTNNGRSKCLC